MKKVTVEFAPGCFDNFDGTQEELDQLIQEITEQLSSLEFLKENATMVSEEELDALLGILPEDRTLH